MDSLKFFLGVAIMILCMGLIGVIIWIILFGLPKEAMDGGTLVQVFTGLRERIGCLKTLI
ncbi:MAG: hypothetical protein HFG49_15755 [Lachnospiraceae bacterium]|jgi:hypothetical protein|nr:hypothetical protein [Lachnospiraceae bacterium]